MIAFPPGEDLANEGRLAPARLSAVDDEGECGAGEQIDASRATPASVAGDLGPSGPVAAVLSGATDMPYEDRASQRGMAAAVAELYRTGGVGLFEAGTGVGKSLAYLIPALQWAAAHGDRTVVSTNTINLQEQLVGKDLPLLAAALTDQPVRFALLKGWRNYLCLARLEQARSAGGTLFNAAEERDLAAVAAWARDTEDGSLGDAGAPQPRPEVWDEVAAEPDLCQRQKCPHYNACFVFRARRAAALASIVVVNHHLLMSDVAVRRVQQNWHDVAVLPPYSRLVVDEGHHLEEAAAAHLGSTVTRRGWQRLFARLDRRGGKGLLARLTQALGSADGLLGAATLDLLRTSVTPAVAAARERGELVFDMLATILVSSSDRQLRLTAEIRRPSCVGRRIGGRAGRSAAGRGCGRRGAGADRAAPRGGRGGRRGCGAKFWRSYAAWPGGWPLGRRPSEWRSIPLTAVRQSYGGSRCGGRRATGTAGTPRPKARPRRTSPCA